MLRLSLGFLVCAFLPFTLATAPACSSGSSGSGGGGAGGGGGGGNTHPGSCAKGKNSCSPGTDFCCADYAGLFTAAQVQQDCSVAGGQYSTAECTTQDREGTCTLYPGTAAEKTISYYTGYDQASGSDPATNCSALHGQYAGP